MTSLEKEKKVKLSIIVYFIQPSISEVLSFQHMIDQKIIREMFYILSPAKSWKSSVYPVLTTHLSLDEPHFTHSASA